MICCCLDLDGFFVEGQFIVRELGWCDADAKRMGVIHYTHDKTWQHLSVKDRRTVNFVSRHITGLPWIPGPREKDCHSQDQLKEDIVQVWYKCKTQEACRVAFKGGHLERDLCDELRLPTLNLEDLGCPKYEHLTDFDTFHCGCHRGKDIHCAMAECYKFMCWFNKV